jgi:glutamine---fructose-6-phosphate transaminase (isomerizing)
MTRRVTCEKPHELATSLRTVRLRRNEQTMGGIVGIISQTDIVAQLVDAMGRIPYHAGDSCGLVSLNLSILDARKDIGPLQKVSHRREFNLATGRIGIAHVGKLPEVSKVSRKNAQPHLSCDGKFAIVCDGAVSNSHRLRANLETTGRHFSFSETGAEVFGHLLEEAYWVGRSVEEAFTQALRRIEGDFAIAVISICESPRIFCAGKDRPLFVHTDGKTTFLSSHVRVFQFGPTPRQLREGEYAVLFPDGFSVACVSHGDKETFGPNPLLLAE